MLFDFLKAVSDMSPIINGVVVAVLGTIVIPRYLRAPHTGEYIGFRERALQYILLGWAFVCGLILIPRFGWSLETLIRLLVMSTIPFIAALLMIKITDVFGLDNSRQIRK
ncbi:MAG TPA: hypothetical protein DEG76_08920 [Pseudohongiella sp.]|nr:hypothetical protein [Pseudohongiella sp.]HBX37385.1 hypothetical protein [Pseudohongiella sp.]|tara:strand:+ start:924 stop:1253 length:330 start_codon:yes stop_codon:yes gene_type:complete